MSENIIECKGLTKKYSLRYSERYFALRDTISNIFKKNKKFIRRDFSALCDVSFTMNYGEVIGIIGRNGAGKTTLLKILSRITYPTAGEVILRGRVASLLEVGTGFHPELTGRENIYFNGSILGMKKVEIDKKFDEIVSFAEMKEFVEVPVKRYSSGMQLRLAFSVAAHLEPEILLVDEVLAVGDVQFQKKCIGKMNDIAKGGRSIIFVSHNMDAVQRLCSRVILLHEGSIISDGATSEVIKKYLDIGVSQCGERIWETPQDAPGDDVVRILAVRIKDIHGHSTTEFDVRDPVYIETEYEVFCNEYALDVVLSLVSFKGDPILHSLDNLDSQWTGKKRLAGRYMSTCIIPGDFLNDGQIQVDIAISTHPYPRRAWIPDALRFNVKDIMDQGGVRGNYPRKWPVAIVRPRFKWNIVKLGSIAK